MSAVDLRGAEIGAVLAALAPPPSDAADLARYARASGDSNPLHLDPAFARQAGFERLVVHGMLGMAHMGRLLSDTFPAASIKSFSARFRAVILAGEQVHYQATLAAREGRHCRLELSAVTAAGVLAISGEALVDADLASPPAPPPTRTEPSEELE